MNKAVKYKVKKSEGFVQGASLKIKWFLREVENPRGTILLVHGYLDHSALWGNFPVYINTKRYNVLLIDLPGHGKSAGPRGDIKSFKDYGTAIKITVLKFRKLSSSFIFIGHSTGCAAISEYMKNKPLFLPDRIIYLAPLTRIAHSWLINKTLNIIPSGIKKIKRIINKCSHNKIFMQKLKDDPLGLKEIPLSWVRTASLWSKNHTLNINDNIPLLLIQGTGDKKVDWKYSLKIIPEQFNNTTICLIKKARHHLINESKYYRQQVIDAIDEFLD